MGALNFYEIKSQKSQEYVKGIRKTSLVCLNHPELQFFLWIDENGTLKQVQFLFDENLIEWFQGKNELKANETNRKYNIYATKTGIQKGARTIHPTQNRSIIKKGLQIINTSQFPDSYNDLIRHNLLLPYIRVKSS